MEEDTRAVFVSNISPNATEKTVSDFFSFCGRITSLTLRREANSVDAAQEAIVVFETDSAAKTALLLTNALIVDRPITVVSHTPSATEELSLEKPQGDSITVRPQTVPDSERSKTSVVASMVAAGYVLGSDAIGRAKEIDEKHMISLQIKVGAEQIKAKANEIDRQLHITETATAIKTAAIVKAKEVDEKLHISEKVGAAAEIAKQQATALATKANENETVAKGVNMVKAVGTTIQQGFQNLKEESIKAIEEKKQSKEAAGAAAAASTTTTTTTTTPVATPPATSTPPDPSSP